MERSPQPASLLASSTRAMRAWAGLILIAYLLLALWPFRWNDLPRLLANGAVVDDPATIAFPAAGLVRTAKAPPWVQKAMRTRPVRSPPAGPAGFFCAVRPGSHPDRVRLIPTGETSPSARREWRSGRSPAYSRDIVERPALLRDPRRLLPKRLDRDQPSWFAPAGSRFEWTGRPSSARPYLRDRWPPGIPVTAWRWATSSAVIGPGWARSRARLSA